MFTRSQCLPRRGLAADAGRDISWLFELALVLVRLNHIASIMVNADHGSMQHHPGVARPLL